MDAPYFLYLSRDNEPVVIQADSNDLFDYDKQRFFTKKEFVDEDEAQLALDLLTTIVTPAQYGVFCRWVAAHT